MGKKVCAECGKKTTSDINIIDLDGKKIYFCDNDCESRFFLGEDGKK